MILYYLHQKFTNFKIICLNRQITLGNPREDSQQLVDAIVLTTHLWIGQTGFRTLKM